jgi:hypothetical protein
MKKRSRKVRNVDVVGRSWKVDLSAGLLLLLIFFVVEVVYLFGKDLSLTERSWANYLSMFNQFLIIYFLSNSFLKKHTLNVRRECPCCGGGSVPFLQCDIYSLTCLTCERNCEYKHKLVFIFLYWVGVFMSAYMIHRYYPYNLNRYFFIPLGTIELIILFYIKKKLELVECGQSQIT